VQRPLADRLGYSSPTTLVVGVDAVGPWTASIGSFRCPRLTAKQLSNSLALTAFHMNDIGA